MEGPLLLRIYDKVAESQKCSNVLKLCAMIDRRWGGSMPERATRVEFELRREALTERGIDSVDDYFAKRADLVQYLAHEWFWMTADAVDRDNKHQSRAEVLPLWAEVQAALRAWPGMPAGMSLAPLDRAGVDVSQLFKQAYGVIRTAAEYQGKADMALAEFLAYAREGLRRVGAVP